MSTYDPGSIANFFINEAAQVRKNLIPSQLMKLVYISHGWHLGVYKRPLINDPPQALDFGPVIVTLYNALKRYGNDPIPGPILQEVQPSSQTASGVVQPPAPFPLPAESETRAFLKTMWKAYEGFTPADLTTLTNAPGTPWSETWNAHGATYSNGVDIPEASIQAHYEKLNDDVTKRQAPAPATDSVHALSGT